MQGIYKDEDLVTMHFISNAALVGLQVHTIPRWRDEARGNSRGQGGDMDV